MREASWLGIRGRVVVEDLPAFAALLQNQGEGPACDQGITPMQLEASGRVRQIHGQGPRPDLLEGERVARLAGGEVGRLVAVGQLLPTELDVAARQIAGDGVPCG